MQQLSQYLLPLTSIKFTVVLNVPTTYSNYKGNPGNKNHKTLKHNLIDTCLDRQHICNTVLQHYTLNLNKVKNTWPFPIVIFELKKKVI